MCLSSTFRRSLGLSPTEQERDRSSRRLLLFVSKDELRPRSLLLRRTLHRPGARSLRLWPRRRRRRFLVHMQENRSFWSLLACRKPEELHSPGAWSAAGSKSSPRHGVTSRTRRCAAHSSQRRSLETQENPGKEENAGGRREAPIFVPVSALPEATAAGGRGDPRPAQACSLAPGAGPAHPLAAPQRTCRGTRCGTRVRDSRVASEPAASVLLPWGSGQASDPELRTREP